MAHVHLDVKQGKGGAVTCTARLYTGQRGLENPEELPPFVTLNGPARLSTEELLRLWDAVLRHRGYLLTRSVVRVAGESGIRVKLRSLAYTTV